MINNPEECKKYAELISSMSLDYLLNKISWNTYINNLDLIIKCIKTQNETS